MASGPHTFVSLGVFSAEQFKGNPLHIVAVRGNALAQQKKALIAKEFGSTSTVFIHDAPSPTLPRRIEIFAVTGEEVSFSGHSVIGTAHYVFRFCEPEHQNSDKPLKTVLMTKSGPTPVLYNANRQVAACSIPHAFHVHKMQVGFDKVLNVQPQLQIVPTIENYKHQKFPVVSIVKGMTFSLIDLTKTPEILGALEAGKSPEVQLDNDWTPSYIGAIYYKKRDALVQAGEPTIHSVQTRVIANGFEDPGTGSAGSALACYLALNEEVFPNGKPDSEENTSKQVLEMDQVTQKAAEVYLGDQAPRRQRHIYAIQQGIELGRACTIAVEVDLILESSGIKRIESVTLSGKASFFGRGELMRG